ncbi:MAG: hypothetical protein Q9M16_03050 [Mariprofundus sp.]|nr:hypothetical protein [Mariprofundus sp.]
MQLDTDLRLHPRRLNLGRAELLSDALTLPFTDIDSRLGHYVLGATTDEKRQLRRSMKNYLGRLNANPHIPLKFRLKVLNRFEQELDLFDADMTAAVLNAHKIGVALVQEAARLDQKYFPHLVDMISHAIELAIKLLRIDLEHYRPPAIIVTRQFFELAKLGLEISTQLDPAHADKTARLQQAVCKHEFLRRLDFFKHDQAHQQMIWHELQYHIKAIQACFYRKGQHIASANRITLFINLNRPHENGQLIQPSKQQQAAFDCIAMPLDAFIARLGKGIRSVKQVLDDQQQQHKALHTEDALNSTMIGGIAILLALKSEKRHQARQSQKNIKVQLLENLCSSIIKAFPTPQDNNTDADNDVPASWTVVDITADGMCLERIHSATQRPQPGSEKSGEQSDRQSAGQIGELLGKMVGLHWSFAATDDSNTPPSAQQSETIPARLGFIRWVKEHKSGEQRIGIAFFQPRPAQQQAFILAKAIVLGGNQGLQQKRTWPILIKPQKTSHIAIFPDRNIYKNMSFMVLQDDHHHQPFKVRQIMIAGANYTRCEIIPAKSS